SGASATLAIAPRAAGQGTVGVGARGRVVRLRGEVFGEEEAGGDFLGISVIGPELRRTLPIPGCLVGEGLLPWLRAGREIATFRCAVPWDDIGSVESYLQANLRWLEHRSLDFYLGDAVRLGPGVELNSSVIGSQAAVTGGGTLSRCVLWPGA